MTGDDLSQDEAMETFRSMCKFTTRSCWVSRDGKRMTFRVMDNRLADRYLVIARLVISAFNLPLQEQMDAFIGTKGYEANLVLKYTGQ